MCLCFHFLQETSPRGFGLRLASQFPRIPTSCRWHLVQSKNQISLLKQAWTNKFCFSFAERRGFEPRKHFWRLHAFQACLFNHSSISPYAKKAFVTYSGTKLLLFYDIRKNLCIFLHFFVILCRKDALHWLLLYQLCIPQSIYRRPLNFPPHAPSIGFRFVLPDAGQEPYTEHPSQAQSYS